MSSIELGDRVEDRISKFSGVVIAKSEYLNGCRRFAVQPEKLTKEGAMSKDEWFDEPSLVLIKKGIHAAVPIGVVATPKTPARRYAGGPARSGDRSSR